MFRGSIKSKKKHSFIRGTRIIYFNMITNPQILNPKTITLERARDLPWTPRCVNSEWPMWRVRISACGGETKKTDQIIKNTDLCSSRIGLF